jgi:hypothetical protein
MKKTATIFIMLFAVSAANAQLVYENYKLRFGGPSYSTSATTWYGSSHAWMLSSATYTTMDLLSNQTIFGTSTGKISFMNAPALTYNDLYAKKYYTSSDISAKTSISPFTGATKIVLALKPVTYQWKNPAEYLKNHKPSPLSANPKEIGFVAQEVERVLPDAIALDDRGGRLVNYNALIPVLTAAMQELNARIAALEAELKEMKSR